MKKIATILAMAAMLFACGKPEPTPTPDPGTQGTDPENPQKEASINVNTTSQKFSFEADGGEETFQVMGNYDWQVVKTNLDWVTISPDRGEADDLVTIKLIVEENTSEENRTGSFTITIPDKVSKEFSIEQKGKAAVENVILAKWTWSALWCTEEPNAPTNKTNTLSAAGKAAAEAWLGPNHQVPSDVVPGGTLGFYTTSPSVTYSMGPATHKKNRFRVTAINLNDYYWFRLDNVKAEAGSVISMHNLFLQVANITKAHGEYALEWSTDNSSWTKIKDVKVDNTAANVPENLSCSVVLPNSLDGSFWLRLRVANTQSADGTVVIEDTNNNSLPMLTTDDSQYPATNSYDVRDAFYDEDWAYVFFDLAAPGSAPIEIEPTLNVSKEVIELSATGGEEASFTVRSNYAWSISAPQWASVTPSAGGPDETTTVTVTAQDNDSSDLREGKIIVEVTGKGLSKEILLTQKGKPAEARVVAKWTWSAIWEAYTASGVSYSNDVSAAGKTACQNWVSGKEVESDIVEGGSISFSNSNATLSVGTGGQIKNRLRAAALAKDDAFCFKVSASGLKPGQTISFLNAYLQTANVNKGPGSFAIEYSVDGTSWTGVKDITLPTTANKPTSLDCEFVLPDSFNGTFWLRVRIASETNAAGTGNFDSSGIAMITTNDAKYPSPASNATRDAFYEDEWAFILFTAK